MTAAADGAMAKLGAMKQFLDTVSQQRQLKDYEQATLFVISNCFDVIQRIRGGGSASAGLGAPSSAPTSAAAAGSGGGGAGPAPAATPSALPQINPRASQAVEYFTCGWLEKQSGGHSEIATMANRQKRKITFGQAVLKWDIRFCVLELNPQSMEVRPSCFPRLLPPCR